MTTRKRELAGKALTAQSADPPLDFQGLDELLGYRLRRAQGAVHRDYVAAVGELRLTQKQTAVLWLVRANPGVSQGAVGATLGMDRATMMALVDRMEARGLLRRQRSSVDARRRELHATPKGARLMVQLRRRVEAHEAAVARLFTPAERRTFERLLRRLQQRDADRDSG